MAKIILTTLCLLSIVTGNAWARGEIAGPVAAEVLRVIDGDTLLVEAMPWPQQRIEVYVRIRGIDAPEVRAGCSNLRQAALNAREVLDAIAGTATTVHLLNITGDKYYGRVVADVILPDGRSAASSMLLVEMVQSYEGGRKPKRECDR